MTRDWTVESLFSHGLGFFLPCASKPGLLFQADVVIKFPEEEAPSTVLSQNLFTPKQEIQVKSKGVIH